MTANRFLWKWNVRLLRQEWPIQAAILAIVAMATAVSVGAVAVAYNLIPPPERDYGNGQVKASITGDASLVAASLEDHGHPFGEIEAIAASLPGSAQKIEIRVQDPTNPVAEPLLGLLDGRWPSGPGEVAATDGALRLLNTELGADATVAGHRVRIVGLVEDPTDFDHEFVHAPAMDPFEVEPDRVSTVFLVDAAPLDVVFPAGMSGLGVETTDSDARTIVALGVDLAAAVAMLEVALLAGAGFAIIGRRRARQHGLLGAIGAPPRYVRRIAAMNGLAIGVVAALAGSAAGLAASAVLLPNVEGNVGHRIVFEAPVWAIAPVVAMAIVAAGLAAWWPSRTSTRQSIVASLASQRPESRPVARTVAAGLVATPVGAVALAIGFVQAAFFVAITGILIALVGLLMLSPGAVRLIGQGAGRLPLVMRLAARAVARQQGRSATVMAALVLALGVPVGLAVVTASIDDHQRRSELNLPEHMAILWLPGAEDSSPLIPADLDAAGAEEALDRVMASVEGARVVPLELAVDPEQSSFPTQFEQAGLRPAISPDLGLRPVTEPCNCNVAAYGDRDESGAELLFSEHDAWVANRSLLDALGIDGPTGERRGAGLSRWDDAVLHSNRQPGDDPEQRLASSSALPPFGSIAPVLIWPETVADKGWTTVTAGWLIVADAPLTPATIDDIETASGLDLLTEVTIVPSPRSAIRALGLLAGAMIGFGILASVVTLHVAESATDLRTLRAIGASPRVGRRLMSATGAILAASAAVVAVPVGYLPLVPLLADRQLDLRLVVPWLSVAAVLLVFPLLAAGIGWVVSFRASTVARLVR